MNQLFNNITERNEEAHHEHASLDYDVHLVMLTFIAQLF